MFKKIIVFTFIFITLTGCGSSDNAETPALTDKSTLTIKKYDDFSIGLPATWDILGQDQTLLPTPNQGSIELAVTSTKKTSGFYNNLLILSDVLSRYTSSKDFSILNNVGASDEYLEYQDIDSKDFTFADGEESKIYIFEARYNINTPKVKFIQTARVCNANKGFLLTISIPITIATTQQYEDLLKTFQCNLSEGVK